MYFPTLTTRWGKHAGLENGKSGLTRDVNKEEILQKKSQSRKFTCDLERQVEVENSGTQVTKGPLVEVAILFTDINKVSIF